MAVFAVVLVVAMAVLHLSLVQADFVYADFNETAGIKVSISC